MRPEDKVHVGALVILSLAWMCFQVYLVYYWLETL